MALFKIFNNFGNPNNSITSVQTHKAGYCYFDVSTNKFYVDTVDNQASGLRQLNGTYYGECTDAGATANKTVNIVGFGLTIGVSVYIKFTAPNSANPSDLTLNVSGTGNIPIKRYNNVNLISTQNIMEGMVCQFLYDGNYWLWVGYLGYNSDEKLKQSLTDISIERPLLLSYTDKDTNTTNITNTAYRTNKIYANPNTGTLTAINFSGKFNNHTINSDVPANAVFTDTTYSATNGIGLNTSTNTFYNAGVRSISEGTTPGTIIANINGVQRIVSVPGFAQDGSGNSISDTYLTKAAGVTNVAWDATNKKITKTINSVVSDVVDINTIIAEIPTPTMHTLTFGAGGAYTYDGSTDVTVPVYTGDII